MPELALAYCDRVYESVPHQPSSRSSGNIYLTLLQIYLNPRKTTKNFEKRITNLVSSQNTSALKVGSGSSFKAKGGRAAKKIAAIEGAEDVRTNPSGTDSGRSDGDVEEPIEEGVSTIMLDDVLVLLGQRWDRINGAQALKLLPRETKLQVLHALFLDELQNVKHQFCTLRFFLMYVLKLNLFSFIVKTIFVMEILGFVGLSQ